MSKSILAGTLMVTVLILLAVAGACAPSAPAKPSPVTPPVATPPATPAPAPTTPPEAATPPAATPAAAKPIEDADLSFKPASYTNDDLGFTYRYPKGWVEAPAAWRCQIFAAKDPAGLPSTQITVYPVDTLDKAKDLLVTEFYKPKGVNDAKWKPEADYTLYDGTKCKLVDWTYTWPGIALETYALAMERKGNWVVFGITAPQGMMDYEACKEVFNALIIK